MSEPERKPGRRQGSQNYDPEFRRRLTLASFEPGVSVSKLARENGINANMLFSWRKRYREKQREAAQVAAATLVPVAVIEAPRKSMDVVTPPLAEADAPGQAIAGGTIEVRIGRAVIRVNGSVDAETLRTVLESLRS